MSSDDRSAQDAAVLLKHLDCCSLKGVMLFNMTRTDNGSVATSFSIPFQTTLPDRLSMYIFCIFILSSSYLCFATALMCCSQDLRTSSSNSPRATRLLRSPKNCTRTSLSILLHTKALINATGFLDRYGGCCTSISAPTPATAPSPDGRYLLLCCMLQAATLLTK